MGLLYCKWKLFGRWLFGIFYVIRKIGIKVGCGVGKCVILGF